MRVARHGMDAELPRGWEGRIYRRDADVAAAAAGEAGTVQPILHAGTFPLPVERGDYGSDAVDVMEDADVFVALVEFDPEAAETELFSRRGVPWPLQVGAFASNRLHRTIAGQAGSQFFFNHAGRAYCLYVVLGRDHDLEPLVERVNEMLAGLQLASLEERDR